MANGITPFTPLRTKLSWYLYYLTTPKPACRGRCVRARDRVHDGGWGARVDPRSSNCGRRAPHQTSSCNCARLARWRILLVGHWCELRKCHPAMLPSRYWLVDPEKGGEGKR